MKTTNILTYIILLFLNSQAWAWDSFNSMDLSSEKERKEYNFSSEVILYSNYNLMPTSEAGKLEFLVHELNTKIDIPLMRENIFSIGFKWQGPEDSSTSSQGSLKLSRAFLDVPLGESSNSIRYGVLPFAWGELSEEDWGSSYVGRFAKDPLLRFKYENDSDSGIAFLKNVGSMSFDFSIVNGEGEQTREKAGRKEVRIISEIRFEAPFKFRLGYSKGAYESFDSSVFLKERTLLGLVISPRWGQILFQVVDMKDNADALASLSAGDGYNYTTLSGKNIKGRLADLRSYVFFYEKWQGQIILTYLLPDVTNSKKAYASTFFGFNYEQNPDLQWNVGYYHSERSEGYGLVSSINEQFRVSTKLDF